MNKLQRILHLLGAAAVAVMLGGTAQAADINFGKPGEPVELVVGYQPYYTQSWSGVVMRGKKFYEKYLPKGSDITTQSWSGVVMRGKKFYEKYLPKGSYIEFQIGLQGAIIVNNMLAGKQNLGYMVDMPSIV